MFNELHDLSLAMRTVSESHASRVVMAVLRKFDAHLREPLIRIYRKESAKSGIILKPFAVNRSPLDPEPIAIAFDDTPQGLLSWSYHYQKPLWLESISNTDLSQGATNRCDGELIAPEYLDFTYEQDSTVVIPLLAEGNLSGVFSLELEDCHRSP